MTVRSRMMLSKAPRGHISEGMAASKRDSPIWSCICPRLDRSSIQLIGLLVAVACARPVGSEGARTVPSSQPARGSLVRGAADAAASQAASVLPLADGIAVQPLADGLWLHTSTDADGTPANGAIVRTASGLVVIDATWSTASAVALLDWIQGNLRMPVQRAIVTHSHQDRAGGWMPAQRVLHGGCLIKAEVAESLGFVGDADVGHWAEAVRSVARRYPHPVHVIPGHGTPGGPAAMEHTIALVQRQLSTASSQPRPSP